jgi:hypothetical protein
MKILLTGDWHIHSYPQFAKPWMPGLNTRAKQIADALEPIPQIIKQEKVRLFVHLGDWNWVSSNPYRLVNFTRQSAKACETAVKHNGGVALGIPGNHDTDGVDVSDHNNRPYLDSTDWDVKVHQAENIKFYSVGYNSPLPNPDTLATNHALSIFLIHKDIAGGKASSGFIYKTDNSIPMSWFSAVAKRLGKNVKFFAGHYHSPQTIGPVNVIGAPVQHNRGDAGDERGFAIYDTEKRILTKVALPGPEFMDVPWKTIYDGKLKIHRVDKAYITILCNDAIEYRDAGEWKKTVNMNIQRLIVKKEESKIKTATKSDVGMLSEEELLVKYLQEKECITSKQAIKDLIKIAKDIQ